MKKRWFFISLCGRCGWDLKRDSITSLALRSRMTKKGEVVGGILLAFFDGIWYNIDRKITFC
jgi:hypothetical protein